MRSRQGGCWWSVLPLVIFTAMGCGSDDGGGGGGGEGGGGEGGGDVGGGDAGASSSDFTVGTLEFGDCPSTLPGISRDRTCATASVPLLYDDPDGKRIELLVAHYPAEGASLGQLWLLDGGPGGTGGTYMNEQVLPVYLKLGLDIFIPQHRGTGHSTPLLCDDPEDLVDCGEALVAEWGDGLRGFSSAAAAEDLGHLIEAARSDQEPVFVLGISYGSYWGQRYLQRYSRQATGVMLDGILPLATKLYDADPLADATGLGLLADCAKDATCLAALDGDPEATARAVLLASEKESTRCRGADGYSRDDASLLMTLMMVLEIPEFIPATLLRMHRCSEQDQVELDALDVVINRVLSQLGATDLELDNPVLGAHVLRTDLLAGTDRVPLEELVALRDGLIFRGGAASVEWMDAVVDEWPVNYEVVDTSQSKPETPVLLMNGGYDMQTPLPWMDELAETIDARSIVFPAAGHGVDLSLAASMDTNEPCSIQLKRQFVQDPKSKLDESCLDELALPDFAGEKLKAQSLSQSIFGNPILLPDITAPQPSSLVRGAASPYGAAAEEAARLLLERLDKLPEVRRRMRGFRGR